MMYEEEGHKPQEKYIFDPIDTNRIALHDLNAQYIKFQKVEDIILKQNNQLQWFQEVDTNSRYLHSIIRGIIRKIFIPKIATESEEWIHGEETISLAGCIHFEELFKGNDNPINEATLNFIRRMISCEQNTQITSIPYLNNLKSVFFSMNPDTAAGLDGMNCYFFQKDWHIFIYDLMGVFQAFFRGQMILKYFYNSCIVLLHKLSNSKKLSKFKPISLSNFTSKIISKLVSNILSPILPSLISPNQSLFM